MPEALLVHGHLLLRGDLAREVEREPVGVVELEGDLRGELGPGVAGAAQGLLEDAHALVEGAAEPHLLLVDDAADLRLRLDEGGVGAAHVLHDRVGEGREEGLLHADRDRLLHGAADDAPQHVVAAVVAGQDAVHDQEGRAARVLGHRPQGAHDRRRGSDLDAGQLRAALDQRPEQVGLEHVGDALGDARDALEPHAGVDAALGQRREVAGLVHVVLHEHEVPVLEVAVAVAARLAVGVVAAHLGAEVVVELGAGPAGAGRPGRAPEVVAAAEADDALVAEAVRLPQLHRLLVRRHLVVAAEDAHPDLVARDPELVGELQRPLDRLGLEVVAEREVAEHLEEGEVPRRLPHVLDVRGAEGALAGGDARGRRRLDAQEVGLVLLHPGGREQHAGVARGHEAGGLARQVPAGDEEVSEQVTDVGSVHGGVLGAWMSVWPQRASSDERGGSGLSRSPISSRSFSSERLMRRETCICDIPTRSAI